MQGTFIQFWCLAFIFMPFIGFCMGRWIPVWIRLLLLLLLVPIGIRAADHSAHGFETFILTNITYIAFLLFGIRTKSEKRSTSYWFIEHIDGILLFLAMAYMLSIYIPPIQ